MNKVVLTDLKLLRPAQWLKNLMIFFPPFLGGVMFLPGVWQKGLLPFASFCLVSSATYIFNDILDAESDALHPRKKHRPIASGRISRQSASLLAVVVLAAGVILGWFEQGLFPLFLLFYLAVAVSYTLRLKNYPLVDVFCIAAGFLFRLEAGGAVFGVTISEWLFLSVFLLAVFLSTGKRLCELRSLGKNAGTHRTVLDGYPPGFLEGVMYLTGSAVLVTYTLYVISRQGMLYTVPLCCFGLLRYILRIMGGGDGDPTESLLKDRWLLLVSIAWVCMVAWGIYWERG